MVKMITITIWIMVVLLGHSETLNGITYYRGNGWSSIEKVSVDVEGDLVVPSCPFYEPLKYIGGRSFLDCSRISTIVFPESLEGFRFFENSDYVSNSSFGRTNCDVFEGCTNLTTMVFLGAPPRGLHQSGLLAWTDKIYFTTQHSNLWTKILYRLGYHGKYGAFSGSWSGEQDLIPSSGNLNSVEPLKLTNFVYTVITNTVFVTNVVEHYTTVTNTIVPEAPTIQLAAKYTEVAGVEKPMILDVAGWDALGLPEGMTWEKQTGTLGGMAVRSGTYDVIFVSGSGAETKMMRTTVEVAGYESITGYVGVDFVWKGVPMSLFENQKSWPSGLKWDVKSKTLSGIPTKVGDFSRATIQGEEVPFAVKALPMAAVGTANGFLKGSEGDYPIAITATAAGKLTAKVSVGARVVTFTAKSWNGWHQAAEGLIFTATLTSTAGDGLVLNCLCPFEGVWTNWTFSGTYTVKGAKNSILPDPGEGVAFTAQRNAYGKIGKDYENVVAHMALATLVGKTTYSSTHTEDGRWILQTTTTTPNPAVTITVKDTGVATFSGKLADGTPVSGAVTILFKDDQQPLIRLYQKGLWIEVK